MTELARQQARIASLVAEGWQNKQIAMELGISVKTVRNHLTLVYRKMGLAHGRRDPRVLLALRMTATNYLNPPKVDEPPPLEYREIYANDIVKDLKA